MSVLGVALISLKMSLTLLHHAISYQLFPLLQKHPGSLLEGFSQIQVSTLAVKDKLLIAGGFQGELICKVIIFILHSYIFLGCVSFVREL